jgi:hypothetical protein
MFRSAWLCLFAMALQLGCAHQKWGASAAGSGNSSAGSGDSSAGSGNSSQGSNNSSANSNNSSANSNNSSQNSDGSSRTSSAESSRDSGRASAVVAGSALLVSTAVGIGFAIYATVRAANKPTVDQAKTAMRYLRSNLHQLQQDLALGAGPALDDLAAAAQIRSENRRQFARVLQRHRVELLTLARAEDLTPARALRFLERIGELAAADPTLRQDCDAFFAKHEAVGGG